ncbi:aldo/keto reductase [bacterium]|nr:MAG: aldo/keto reductase [bacterium]
MHIYNQKGGNLWIGLIGFYFGTWQLGGQFKNLSTEYIESLLLFAVRSGIRRFDTAAVYGGGKVEAMLGACLPEDVTIVTKIPAAIKPNLEDLNRLKDFTHKAIYIEVCTDPWKGCVDLLLMQCFCITGCRHGHQKAGSNPRMPEWTQE